MIIIDNLKLLGEKKNRLYLILVVWLLIGEVVIQLFPIIGIFIFLPFLAFLLYLLVLSFITKKDIREYSAWKLILLLILLIPLMLVMAIVLVVLFAVSIISYVFMTSWFILYGIILMSKKGDNLLRELPLKSLMRSIEFFGGILLAGILLFLFYYAPKLDVQKIIFETEVPPLLNYVYLIVGIVLAGLAAICLILMFKKSFNAWFGIFSIVAATYSFFLALKIFLGLNDPGSTSETSPLTEIALLVVDLSILVYAISTLLGSNAELLAKQLKHFGIDTIFIWLLFSKVSYEFVVNFPFEYILSLLNQGILSPFSTYLSIIDIPNEDSISFAKNIAVLVFFLLLLILLGLWEIRKYNRSRKKDIQGELGTIEKSDAPVANGGVEQTEKISLTTKTEEKEDV